MSALLPGAQQREGVLDALVEDLIGELPVGQGAGRAAVSRPSRAKTLSVFTRAEGGSCGARRAATSSMTASRPTVYACLVASVQRPIWSSRAADGQPSAGLSRCPAEVFTHVLLDSGAAGRHRAEAFTLFAELVGDRGGDQVFLGWEVGVKGAVGRPGVGHERRDPGAVDAVALRRAARPSR